MKKLARLSMTILFAMAFIQLPAKGVRKEILKSAITKERKEIKTERQQLRKLEGSSVDQFTKEAFFTDFGNHSDVQWKRADYLDEAVFTKDGKQMKAYYDFDSKLVGTTTMKTFTDIPQYAQTEIKTKYKDYTIGPVVFFEDNAENEMNMMLWGTQFEDADNYFVELSKADNHIVLEVNPKGEIFFFKKI